MDARRTLNRRRHERFALPAMYTTLEARRSAHADDERLTGHVYDISEGGARVEFDEPLPPGEPLQIRFTLPGQAIGIHAHADVVWVNSEEDDPGPRRMALRFTDFMTSADHQRLLRYLGSHARRAAA